MAAKHGEENVATLFGDVHYFYGPPTEYPRHHRFDKGSYVYLFENPGDRRARIEIANQPGTEHQDAFDGFLDKAHLRYSYKQTCVVTITVGETADQIEWHLPTFDPNNQNKYHYKLHSLDLYFWTQQDALQFVNGIRRVLPPAQVEVLDEPGPPPQPAEMSSVVKKLEQAAISDPAYGTPNPPSQGAPSFAPPPVAAAEPSTFVPMAYNPAAPAAPESVRHREKTPPPEDDSVNPLAAAVAYDYQQQPFSPGFAPPPGVASPGFAPPAYGAAPTHPGIARSATMPVHAGMASPGLASPYGAGFPGSPGFAPPPTQAHLGSVHAQSTPPGNPGLPPPPLGGYSQYSYSNLAQGRGGADPSYAIHQQVYRPTESEASHHKPYTAKQEPRGKLEENAGRLERGVTGMLKKFEKKFG